MNECLQHDDCLYNLFLWLDIKNLIKCSLVNKQFLNISQHELLWKKLYDFNIPCYCHYYQTFKQLNKLNQFLLRYTHNSLNETLFLQKLYLYNKQLKTIPSALSQCQQLQSFDLCYNQLTDISALGQCQQLQWLDLSHNQLTDISALGQLQQLQILDLSDNQLKDISILGQLQQLQWLDLSHNQLTDISALGQLLQLKVLNLSHNQLTIIPIQILDIKKLIKIIIDKNVYDNLPEKYKKLKKIQIS